MNNAAELINVAYILDNRRICNYNKNIQTTNKKLIVVKIQITTSLKNASDPHISERKAHRGIF